MRNCILAITTAALLGSAAMAQERAPQTSNILAVLDQKMPEITFEDTAFEQVMDYLQELTGLNIVVRWPILEASNIEREKPITVNARNLRFSQILWMVMNEAGGTDVKLAYRASGNLLVLSTQADLGQEMLVRVYDVNDLLARVPRFTSAPELDLTQASQNQGQGGGGQNIFGGAGGGNQDDDDDEENQGGGANGQDQDPDMQRLIDLIVQTIEPDSWQINSGTGGGTIQAFRRQLVVRNNILVHQKLNGPVFDSGPN